MGQEKRYDIAVSTATQYLADQSDEGAGRYVFAYTITIRNPGNVTAQLISRHWFITDAQGTEILRRFLDTAFEGGRHQRRVEKLDHA